MGSMPVTDPCSRYPRHEVELSDLFHVSLFEELRTMHRSLCIAVIVLTSSVSLAQEQAYKQIPSGIKLGRHGTHMIELDIELKKDSIIHIVGRTEVTRTKGSEKISAWSGIDIDQGNPKQFVFMRASMQAPVFDGTNPVPITTTYGTRLKAGKHKIYWNFASIPGHSAGSELTIIHGGTLAVQIFDGSVGGDLTVDTNPTSDTLVYKYDDNAK